ncbi:hypothetical protein PENTCL1PPCAC_5610, partial [Pristionchus entomophagus]
RWCIVCQSRQTEVFSFSERPDQKSAWISILSNGCEEESQRLWDEVSTWPRKYLCRSHFPSNAIEKLPDGFTRLSHDAKPLRTLLPVSSTSSPLLHSPYGDSGTAEPQRSQWRQPYFNSTPRAYTTPSPLSHSPYDHNGAAEPQFGLLGQPYLNSV